MFPFFSACSRHTLLLFVCDIVTHPYFNIFGATGDAFVGAAMAQRIMTGGPILPPGCEVDLTPSSITSPNKVLRNDATNVVTTATNGNIPNGISSSSTNVACRVQMAAAAADRASATKQQLQAAANGAATTAGQASW